MQVIYRYINTSIIMHCISICIIFLCIASVVQIISQLKSLGIGQYDSYAMCKYVLFLVPRNLYKLAPIIVITTFLYSAYRFNVTHELVALSSMGIALSDIIKQLSLGMIILTCVFFCIGEYFAPNLERQAKDAKIMAMSNGNIHVRDTSIWMHVDDWYVNFSVNDADNSLKNFTRYKVANANISRIEFSDLVRYDHKQFVMHDVQWVNISKEKLVSGLIKSMPIHLGLSAGMIQDLHINPRGQSLLQLFYFIQSDSAISGETQAFSYVFWQRLLYPVTLLLLCYVSTSICFKQTDTAFGKKLFSVFILILLSFFAKDYTINVCSYYDLNPIIVSMLFPGVLFVWYYIVGIGGIPRKYTL